MDIQSEKIILFFLLSLIAQKHGMNIHMCADATQLYVTSSQFPNNFVNSKMQVFVSPKDSARNLGAMFDKHLHLMMINNYQ